MSKKAPPVADPASSMPVATHFAGADLLPNLTDLRRSSGVTREYWYWVGVTPDCPVACLDLAGINFPKVNDLLVPDPMGGKKRRVPVIGALVRLDERRVRLMRERLPRTILRMTKTPAVPNESAMRGVENVGDPDRPAQQGFPITIPTAAEIKERQAKGRPTRTYTPDPKDVPAAKFMFAVLCADQNKGARGQYYPETLDITGLVWPDEIDDKSFLS